MRNDQKGKSHLEVYSYQYSLVSYNVLSLLVKVLKQTAWKKKKLISGYNPIGSDSRETTL